MQTNKTIKAWFRQLLLNVIPVFLRSGTDKFPTVIDVIEELTEQVLKLDDTDKARFRVIGQKAWAEVSPYRGDILVTFYYPYQESIEKVFRAQSIDLPNFWGLKSYRKGKTATFLLARTHKDSIALCLHNIFKKLYDYENSYEIKGKLILEFWQYK